MRNKLFIVATLSIPFFGIVNFAHATTVFVAPTVVSSTQESTVSATFSTTSTNRTALYLFTPSGMNDNGNASSGFADNTKSWTALNFPTGLSAGAWTVEAIGISSSTYPLSQANTNCGAGQTLSSCIANATVGFAGATEQIQVASVTGNASSADLLATSDIDLTYFEQAMIYGLILGLFLGIVSKSVKKLQIF